MYPICEMTIIYIIKYKNDTHPYTIYSDDYNTSLFILSFVATYKSKLMESIF